MEECQNMYRSKLMIESAAPRLFSLNLWNIDQLFPGFAAGDFAVVYGTESVLSFASLRCVRAQLPVQLGVFGSSVVFVDGGNSFRLYHVTRLARVHQLDPKIVLSRIFISRAFTAYQMTTLILQKLETVVKETKAKLVLVSDIAATFLDKDVDDEEAQRIFNQLTVRLANFARKNNVMVIATYPPHADSRRNLYLQALTCARANVVIALRQSQYELELVLEKHNRFTLGSVVLPSETLPLTVFMEET